MQFIDFKASTQKTPPRDHHWRRVDIRTISTIINIVNTPASQNRFFSFPFDVRLHSMMMTNPGRRRRPCQLAIMYFFRCGKSMEGVLIVSRLPHPPDDFSLLQRLLL